MKTVFSAFSMLAYDDLQLDSFIVDFSTSSTDGTPGGSVSTDMDAASAASVSGAVNMEYGGGALDSHISVSDPPPTATAFDNDSGSPIIVQIAPDNVQNEGNITDHFTGGGGFVFSADVVPVINTDILITAATGPDSGLIGDGNFAIVLDSIVDSFEPTATNDSSVVSDDANDFAVISGLTDSTGNLESSPISLDVYPSGSGSIVSDNSFVAREGSALGFDSSALSAEPTITAPLGALSSEFTSNPSPAYIYNTAVEVHNPAALSEGSVPPSSVPSIMTFGDLGESPASLVQTSSAAPGNASSGLVINITYDASVNNAPAGFEAVVASVVQFYESEISNPITLNIDVGWGEIAQQGMMPGALGESESYLEAFSYSQIRSALIANATSSTQFSAFNALPTSAPVNGPFYLTLADATALGLYSSGTTLDGYVGVNSSYPFAYNDSTGVPTGEYDLYGVVAHEITEVMGRISMVASGGYSDLDLFRYSAPGVFSASTGYVSSNGGNTVLNYLNSNPSGDLGDWASSAGNDSYDAFSNSGVVNSVTQADLTVMNILGYDLGSQTSQTPTLTVTAQTANQTWAQNQAVNFTLAANTFTDPQHEALTYSATLSTGAALPAWLHFNAATETFTGTVPSGASGLTVEVTATDTSGLSASETFAVATPAAPTVTAQTANQTWAQNKAVNFTLAANTFTDPQQEALTYSATLSTGAALPAWLHFNAATETFTGTVPSGASGLTVEVTATDTSGLSASETFAVAMPGAPTVTDQTANQTWAQNQAVNFTLAANTFTDPQQETLTYAATLLAGAALPAWLHFNAATETFTGTVPSGASGLTIEVTATDTGGLSTSETFSVVTPAAPTVTNYTANQTWAQNKAVNFTLAANTFTDPQQEALTYSATLSTGAALPAWLHFNAATETFTGTVPSAASGLTIEVTATDTGGLSTSETFAVATPAAPTVTAQTANQTWAQAVNFTLAANTFTDPQQEALTYSATLSTGAALPAWLHFNAATETFTGTVPSGASGLTVEVTATDTSGLSASETFAVAMPGAPTVTDQTANQTWAQAVNFTLAANTFTDPQQEALTYSATLSTGAALPAWLHFNAATETFTGTVPSGASGLSIEVTATDTGGLSASETFAVAMLGAPTVNVNSFTVAAQQSVAASSFFTISNPSSDSITEYSFKDNGGGSGHFALAGTAEPDGQVITVSAANLSSVQYVGGASAGTDTLIADAYDATTGAWMPSVSLSVVTTAPFPIANNNDVTEAVYIGYFGRAGDPSGDSYWFNQLNGGNISASGMAASFSVQPEAQTLYSFLASPSSATQAQITSFIESVYQDLFNRAADSSGLAFWQNNLTSNLGNPQAVGAFILNVISGAQGSDQTTIINKVTVADYFTQELASAGISFTSAANTLAHSAIASVTSASSTVLAAESTISSWVTTTTQSTGVEVPLVGTSDTSPLSTVHYI